jgi:lysophospholipase L1-like esterase
MRTLRLVAAIGFLLQLAAPIAACGKGSNVPRVPPPDPRRFESEILAFAAADSAALPPIGTVVFYGSSSIRMWHDRLAADFDPLPVVGRGFGGSTMSEAAYWVDRVVAPLRPWAVVLYEGDNDIEMGRSPEQVVADFDLLAAKLRSSVPGVHLFVLSIKPSGARWKKWPAMQATNALLTAACRRPYSQMTFVDVAIPLLDRNGHPRPEMYLADRLHLSPQGYDSWRDVLQPVLHEAFGPLLGEHGSGSGVIRLPARLRPKANSNSTR